LWTDHFCDSCLRRVPRYSSTWEGFGLLVEEIERQGWDHFTERSEAMGCGIGTVNRNDGPRDWAMMPPRHTCIGIDIRHALALAARDAFRAKKEAEGVKK
ncbi:MAG TPA: hypothetical protein PKD78_13125, partial [Saprospiraceae bacterium]|nr:hypothetical protein [Saprospiraceae bacterium]